MKKNKIKFFIKVLGCQYNEWDAVRLTHILKSSGMIEAKAENADFILILNCSVRKSAVDRALGFAKNFQDTKIILSGCVLKTDRNRFEKKNVILWDGKNIQKLTEILGTEVSQKQNDCTGTNLIPIMSGCNNFCSYCAVPYTRGREVSRPPQEILDDIESLIQSGTKEIILLGQNVNSYEFGFANLLEKINDLPGDFTIFFTSNHPKDMTDDIIDAIGTLPKVAKTIHLPLQSGSDKVLRSMNRPYTKKQYLDLVAKMKKKIKGLKITTDTIVGFPTETEEDFQETLKVFKKVGFEQAFNNKYSPREGTAAFKLGDPIPWGEKQRRWKILNDLVNIK